MRVPEYQEQFRYQGRQGTGRLHENHAGEDPSLLALERAGGAAKQAGQALLQASERVAKTKDDVSKAKATMQINELSKLFMQKKTELSQRKGENALTVSKDLATWQEEQKERAKQNLGDNEMALAYFNYQSDSVFAEQKNWGDIYQNQEKERFLDSTYQSTLDLEGDNYLNNIENAENMAIAQGKAFDAIQDYVNRKGLGQDVAKNLYKQWISKNIVSGTQMHIDNEQLGKAHSFLEKNKPMLSADVYTSLNKRIRNASEIAREKARIKQEQFQKQQVANTIAMLVDNHKKFIDTNIDSVPKDNLYVFLRENINAMTDDEAIREKAFERCKKYLDEQYELKDKKIAIKAQDILASSLSTEEKMQEINNLPLDDDSKNTMEKIILQKDAKTTDYNGYSLVQDNISKGMYANYNEFLADTAKVQMTKEDRAILTKFYQEQNNPVEKEYVENIKEAEKLFSIGTKKPENPLQAIQQQNKEQRYHGIYMFQVNKFIRENNRNPNKTECYDIAKNVLQENILTGLGKEKNVNFMKELYSIGEDFEEENKKSFDYEAQLKGAEILLEQAKLPISEENILRVLKSKDKDIEIMNIKTGKEHERVWEQGKERIREISEEEQKNKPIKTIFNNSYVSWENQY